MKYAILGPQKGINRITDTEPQNVPEQATVAEITDEQAALIEAGRTTSPPIRYFLIDGELKTMQEKMEAEREMREATRYAVMTTAEKVKFAFTRGHTISGTTYGIGEKDQIAWTQALTALDNAAALGAFDATVTPVEAVLGPILDRDGNPAPSMTVMQFRGVMAQLAIRIGQLRAGNL